MTTSNSYGHVCIPSALCHSDNESKRPLLKDLYDYVVQEAAIKWNDLGAQLLDSDCIVVLNNIERNYPFVEDRCKCVLRKWLETNTNPSWDQLIKALESPSVELNQLALKIKQMLEMRKNKMSLNEINVAGKELKKLEAQSNIYHTRNLNTQRKMKSIVKHKPFRNFVGLIILSTALSALVCFTGAVPRRKFHFMWQSFPEVDSDDKSGMQTLDIVTANLWITQHNDFNKITAPTIVKMSNVSAILQKEKYGYFQPVPFFAFERGYKMGLNFEIDHSDNSLSAGIFVMMGPYDDELQESGQWPLSGTFIIELLNQHSDSGHHKTTMLLNDQICSDCVERVTPGRDTTYAHGTDLISLKALVDNTQYYENGDLFFRISYTSCYSCVFIEKFIWVLLRVLALFVLDVSSTLILLKFVFGCKIITADLLNIKSVIEDLLICTLYLILFAFVEEILRLVMGLYNDYHYHAIVFLYVNNRIGSVLLHSAVVSGYTYRNKHCITIRPIWLVAYAVINNNLMIVPIMIICIAFINFIVNNF